MKKIYLGTVSMEKNRWEPGRVPTFNVSDFIDRAMADGFDGIELWEYHYTHASDEEKAKLVASKVPFIFNSYTSFVERDEELISMLIELETDFWHHVDNNIPPALDGSEASAKFLVERFPGSIPQSKIPLPDTAIDLIHKDKDACEQLETVTQQKQESENLLKQMLGSNEIGTVGNHIISWKSVVQERLDSKTLKAEHPTLYRKYSNTTSYRRFSIRTAE